MLPYKSIVSPKSFSSNSSMHSEAKTLALLGGRLKRARLQLGLTQAQVAERAGFDPQYYNRIERGKVNVTFLTLQRISSALAIFPGALCAAALPWPDPIAADICAGLSQLVAEKRVRELRKMRESLNSVKGISCSCTNGHCPAYSSTARSNHSPPRAHRTHRSRN
jgi:transcriptional regulator with XRE-family HTH domain